MNNKFIIMKVIWLAIVISMISNVQADNNIKKYFKRISSSETLVVPFGSGGVFTALEYNGYVEIDINGYGTVNPDQILLNDAFYWFDPAFESSPSAFQGAVPLLLNFLGSICSTPPNYYLNDFIVFIDGLGFVQPGTNPPYSNDHNYKIVLNLGNNTTKFFLGVYDCGLGDNTGEYNVTISQLIAKKKNQ